MPFQETKPNDFRRGQWPLSASDLNKIARAILRQVRGGGSTDVSYFGDRVVLTSDQANPQLPALSNYVSQFIVLEEFDDYLLCTPFVQPFFPAQTNDGQYKPYNINDCTDDEFDPAKFKKPENAKIQLYVAKPYQLQRSPWDQQHVMLNGYEVRYSFSNIALTGFPIRTATLCDPATHLPLSFSEQQVIVPAYKQNVQNYTPAELQAVPPPTKIKTLAQDVILAVQVVTGLIAFAPGSGNPNPDVQIGWMDINTAARAWAVNVDRTYGYVPPAP